MEGAGCDSCSQIHSMVRQTSRRRRQSNWVLDEGGDFRRWGLRRQRRFSEGGAGMWTEIERGAGVRWLLCRKQEEAGCRGCQTLELELSSVAIGSLPRGLN